MKVAAPEPRSGSSTMLSSESVEWYTPREIVDLAREVMGSIELDPASCPEANEIVRAASYYSEKSDGLKVTWFAPTVWLNPPYGKSDDKNKSNQQRWSHRLMDAHRVGHVEQACMLVNAVPGNKWFRPLWQYPICFIDGRVHFIAPASSPQKDAPQHSSCVVYMGARVVRFAEVFAALGVVVLPSQVVDAKRQLPLIGKGA